MSKGIRRRGREAALKIIYALHDRNRSMEKVLEDFWDNFRFHDDVLGEARDDADEPVHPEVRRFAEALASGVSKNMDDLDKVIGEFSTNWSLERMSRVDLALLRMGTFELLHHPDVPVNVVINEAIEIGKCFGTADTPAFINGILDRIGRKYRQETP